MDRHDRRSDTESMQQQPPAEGEEKAAGSARTPLRTWERFLFGIGVLITASVVLVPSLVFVSRAMTDCDSGGLFAELNCVAGAGLLGTFSGLAVSLVIAGVVVRRWHARPPRRLVPWLTLVVPILAGVGAGVFAVVQSNQQTADVDPCYSSLLASPLQRQPINREDAPRIAFEVGHALCLVNAQGIAEPLYEYQSSGLLDDGLGVISPDGTRVAFRSNEKLFVANLDGSHEEAIFKDGWAVGNLAWSPDSTHIAFHPGGEFPGIWVIEATGSGLKQLTETFADNDPIWSPDGAQIAFLRCKRIEFGCSHPDNLWIMDSDGSIPHQITFGSPTVENPAWSPTGDLIVFEREVWNVWLVEPDGDNERFLLSGGHSPAWSPDSSQIAFFLSSSDIPADQGIWTINVDGTDPQVALYHRGIGVSGIAWLPPANSTPPN